MRTSLRLLCAAVLFYWSTMHTPLCPAHVEATNQVRSADTNRLVIPNLWGPDGRITNEGYRFNTKAYQLEALRLVIEEANKAANDLQLPEELPITRASLTSAFIAGYGQSVAHRGSIGNVSTRDYCYFVSRSNKLCYVESIRQDQSCQQWVDEYQWPENRLDTNGAYQLATQWLAAARMDVTGLNRDCAVAVEPNPFWNQRASPGNFVPIYFVCWRSPKHIAAGYGSAASVQLFAPTKTLISLRVSEPSYILRPALVFTNLEALLSDPEK